MISLEAEEEENGWDESLQSKEEIAKVRNKNNIRSIIIFYCKNCHLLLLINDI